MIKKELGRIFMTDTISSHIFMFPFRWEIADFNSRFFSEQIKLDSIQWAESFNWERVHLLPSDEKEADNLYNERNYFYDFVHPALYDDGSKDTLIRHYERLEPKQGCEVTYWIVCGVNHTEYVLNVQSVTLNFYSSGVGVLSIYLHNNRYSGINDILAINQYGRRIFPAFINDVNIRTELAHSIGFEGMRGIYHEDFSNYNNKSRSNMPALLISKMVNEVAQNIILQPVVDDRMFVLCWYKNDEFAQQFQKDNDGYKEFLYSDWWYKYVFVDGEYKTCPNDELSHCLIETATYPRWQQWGTLYGVSRYSMVMLTGKSCPDFLTVYFETEYARMAELALMQRASVLRFSSEVTKLSKRAMQKDFGARTVSLYKEYIRFENQLSFREISAQEQGIEMYDKLLGAMNLGIQIEKLDDEIEELHNFVILCEERRINQTMSRLTWIATIFLPVTVITGYFSMNDYAVNNKFFLQSSIMIAFAILVIMTVLIINKKNIK